MKKIVSKFFIVSSILVFTSANKLDLKNAQEIGPPSESAGIAKSAALMVIDYFDLDIDDSDDLNVALTIYNDLFSKCYSQLTN